MALANSVRCGWPYYLDNPDPRAESLFAMRRGIPPARSRRGHGLRLQNRADAVVRATPARRETCSGSRRVSRVTSVAAHESRYEDIASTVVLQRGELTARHLCRALSIPNVDDQAKIGIGHAFGGPFLASVLSRLCGTVRWFATAYFFEPFTNQPGSHGLLSDEMHPVSLMRTA